MMVLQLPMSDVVVITNEAMKRANVSVQSFRALEPYRGSQEHDRDGCLIGKILIGLKDIKVIRAEQDDRQFADQEHDEQSESLNPVC
jgi:hypothetical protein